MTTYMCLVVKLMCKILREKCNKLDPKSRKCIFMGYGESGKMGYHLWERKIVCISDIIFNDEKKMHK